MPRKAQSTLGFGKKSFEPLDYDLDFALEPRRLVDTEFKVRFSGKLLFDEDESGSKQSVAGTVSGLLVNSGQAHDHNVSVFDVLDEDSEEDYDYYGAFYDPETDYLREDLGLENSFGDILIVHRIEIDPKHRGNKLGLLVLLETIYTFGSGCSMVGIKPFPLQFESRDKKENNPKFREALRKLEKHWGSLGFRRAKGTEYFYFDLAYKLPTPEEVLGSE